MDKNQKQKFKIRLITLNEKLRKKQDLEMEINRGWNVLLREESLTNTDRHLISTALNSQFGSIESRIKQEYKDHNRELPEILRDWM